jgi:hypothetical protein
MSNSCVEHCRFSELANKWVNSKHDMVTIELIFVCSSCYSSEIWRGSLMCSREKIYYGDR